MLFARMHPYYNAQCFAENIPAGLNALWDGCEITDMPNLKLP